MRLNGWMDSEEDLEVGKEHIWSPGPSLLPRPDANSQKANPNLSLSQIRFCYCFRARKTLIKGHNYKFRQPDSKRSTEIKIELGASILVPVISATHVERHVEDIIKGAVALRSVNQLLSHGVVVIL